jgi:hypothetical protein
VIGHFSRSILLHGFGELVSLLIIYDLIGYLIMFFQEHKLYSIQYDGKNIEGGCQGLLEGKYSNIHLKNLMLG